MSTPHIEAKLGDIADYVLMPGDPLRAKFIADTFLDKPTQYNGVRGMLGYTGEYKGHRITVQGSGMGMPSIGIYSYELYNFYEVTGIIRVGTAGAISSELKVKDIVIAQGACTDSDYARQYELSGTFAPLCSYGLLEKAVEASRKKQVPFKVGNVLSADVFYNENKQAMTNWQKMGVLAVEMESAALYMNAARAGKEALCILTVSDEIFTGVSTTSAERQTAFIDMMEIALETVCAKM